MWLLAAILVDGYDILRAQWTQPPAREPDISSVYDVYHDGNRLIYVTDHCTSDHTGPKFFLHLFPADPKDVDRHRQKYGYNNYDFYFNEVDGRMKGRKGIGAMTKDFWRQGIGGKCVIVGRLPEYPITHIKTGQYIPGQGRLWEGEIRFER